jgi:hypothetical protein
MMRFIVSATEIHKTRDTLKGKQRPSLEDGLCFLCLAIDAYY